MYNTTNYRTALGADTAQAFITKGKQRIKQFNSTVYLNHNDTFEIELFNPNQNRILAKIKLNGAYITSGGIVLRPGERVFLERFLDVDRKFVFSTYSVNGDSKEVKDAIALNGFVEIEFYSEYFPSTSTFLTNSWGNITTNTPWHYPSTVTANANANITFTSNASNAMFSSNVGGVVTDSLSFGVADMNMQSLNNDLAGGNVRGDIRKKSLSKQVETGRVEKGSVSNQQIGYTDGSFLLSPFIKINWQIKPTSVKPYTAEEIGQRFCGECGAKIKKDSFKFCPQCGTKLG